MLSEGERATFRFTMTWTDKRASWVKPPSGKHISSPRPTSSDSTEQESRVHQFPGPTPPRMRATRPAFAFEGSDRKGEIKCHLKSLPPWDFLTAKAGREDECSTLVRELNESVIAKHKDALLCHSAERPTVRASSPCTRGGRTWPRSAPTSSVTGPLWGRGSRFPTRFTARAANRSF